jgi:hypothetical protein
MRLEGVEFAKFPKMPSWLPNCWRLLFLHLQKKRSMPSWDAKLLETPLQQFGKRLSKIWQLGKNSPSPRIFGNLAKGLANPLPACMLRTDHEN